MLTILIGRAKTGKSDTMLRRMAELGESSQQILLVQVTTLHHVLQRLGGHRRTGKAECQQQRGGFHCELTHIYFSQIKK